MTSVDKKRGKKEYGDTEWRGRGIEKGQKRVLRCYSMIEIASGGGGDNKRMSGLSILVCMSARVCA